MFIKFHASSINLDHVLYAVIRANTEGGWTFCIQFIGGQDLQWAGTTREEVEKFLELWHTATLPK